MRRAEGKGYWPEDLSRIAPEGFLLLSLAGVQVGLASNSSKWLSDAEGALGRFAGARAEDISVAYEVVSSTPRGRDQAGDDARGDVCLRCVESQGFELQGRRFEVRADLERRRVWVKGPPALEPLFVVLRYLLPALIQDGALIHGAGLAANGQGWICSGPSGCGKSTIAKLFPSAALCDELVAARWVQGRAMVEALPFWSNRPGVAPLAGIHFLRHGTSHRRTRLSSAEAFRRLSREVLWPTHVPSRVASSLEAIATLIDRIPCYDLEFSPDAEVWPVLVGEVATP